MLLLVLTLSYFPKKSLLLVNFLSPTIFRASTTRLDFIWKSKGESKAKEGERLTSNIHGFRSESKIISKPKRSKLLDLC